MQVLGFTTLLEDMIDNLWFDKQKGQFFRLYIGLCRATRACHLGDPTGPNCEAWVSHRSLQNTPSELFVEKVLWWWKSLIIIKGTSRQIGAYMERNLQVLEAMTSLLYICKYSIYVSTGWFAKWRANDPSDNVFPITVPFSSTEDTRSTEDSRKIQIRVPPRENKSCKRVKSKW